MATWIHAPTVFRLLNPCPDIVSEFTISSQPYSSDKSAQYQLQRFQQWLKLVQPTGRTALTHQIYEIQQLIRSLEQSLRSKGQNVVLIVTSDGLPSDEKGICNDEQCDLFRKSLKALENLPIQVIFRLNTNDSSIRKVRA
jgi:Mg-chelatase subunit ChlD